MPVLSAMLLLSALGRCWLHCLPAGWLLRAAQALAAGQLAPPLPVDALQAIMVPQLGWQWLGQPLQLADCTVRQTCNWASCGSVGASNNWHPTQPWRWMGQWG